jgi:hypothetical protein
MKKRVVIFNALLVVAILFSMLFQSLHSYNHFAKQLSEKKCEHKLISSQEITHQHQGFEHCFLCEFTFSNYTLSKNIFFEFKKSLSNLQSSFLYSNKIIQYFKGSLISLRGPPLFIV